jgi:hypothetical protein
MLGGRIMRPKTGAGHVFLSPMTGRYRTLTGRQGWTRRSSRRTCLDRELVTERERWIWVGELTDCRHGQTGRAEGHRAGVTNTKASDTVDAATGVSAGGLGVSAHLAYSRRLSYRCVTHQMRSMMNLQLEVP